MAVQLKWVTSLHNYNGYKHYKGCDCRPILATLEAESIYYTIHYK